MQINWVAFCVDHRRKRERGENDGESLVLDTA